MHTYQPLTDAVRSSLADLGSVLEVRNGWSRGNALISKAIRYLDTVTLGDLKYKSAVNHVYRRFIFANGISIVFESHVNGGVQVNTWTKILRACEAGKVIGLFEQKVNLSDQDKAELWNRCLMFEGKGYDNKLILLYYIWSRSGRVFNKLLTRNQKDKYTCNEFFCTVGVGLDPLCENIDATYTPEKLICKATGVPSQLLKEDHRFLYDADIDVNLIWMDI